MDASPNLPTDPSQDSMPPGNSAVEIAARKGFGPLSPLVEATWHGDARPCPSCGQLVRRAADVCPSCGEDLSADMAERMRAFAGPWYVLDHVRPFPGVTYERFVRQIRRGVLTNTTVVRGPTTDHQWRFAAEVPGLSKYLGLCWKCQGRVIPQETRCSSCGVGLGDLTDHATGGRVNGDGVAQPDEAPELEAPALKDLRTVVEAMPHAAALDMQLPRSSSKKMPWIVATVLIGVIAVILVVITGTGGRDAPAISSDTPSSPSSIAG